MEDRTRTVFISCGQFSDAEKALGTKVAALVRELTPFEGYFAEYQTSAEALTKSILGRLYDSVGFIAIMHDRGRVSTPSGEITRASVWIEQEIAIAALMQQVAGRPLHVRSYIQEGITIEGVRQHIHLNPKIFRTEQDVLNDLQVALKDWKEPLYMSEVDRQRSIKSVRVTPEVVYGSYPNFSMNVKNHSSVDILIHSVTLWYGQKKLCEPATPEGQNPRKIRSGLKEPVSFKTNSDILQKLVSFAAIERNRPRHIPAPRIDIIIELDIEVLGERIERKEEVSVEIDSNGQIRPVIY
jgi:hypothetical protein